MLKPDERFKERMLGSRKFKTSFGSLLLILALTICSFAAAQDKDAKDKDKSSKKAANNYVKLSGKVRCDKPDTAHAIEVPDRSGHALTIEKRKCTWIEPMVVGGAKMKEGVAVGFAEQMEGTLHTHGFEVDKLESGEDLTMHTNGEISPDKGPATDRGRWNFMRGTGKFKGIKGGGSYDGKVDANDVLTVEFEGVYDPSEMVGGKK